MKDHGQDFLVGNSFSWADVHLLEAILMVEEKKSDVLLGFPQLQVPYTNNTLMAGNVINDISKSVVCR